MIFNKCRYSVVLVDSIRSSVLYPKSNGSTIVANSTGLYVYTAISGQKGHQFIRSDRAHSLWRISLG